LETGTKYVFLGDKPFRESPQDMRGYIKLYTHTYIYIYIYIYIYNMTSAPCCVTMESAALLRFLRNATIETEGLSTSSIVTNATMDGRYYGFRTSTDITECAGICSSEDVV
jgi:hypothetical protein